MAAAKAKASGAAQIPLTSASVYCRIRPFATTGGHAETDDADQKTLEGWDEKTVTIATACMFSKSSAEYRFPKQVLGTEAQQIEVFDAAMPAYVDAFIGDAGTPRNVLFMAYGQTGTGKTHTMFGTDASLRAAPGGAGAKEPDGWGMFPRVASAVFARMAGKKFVLQGSAVEFYVFGCTDLLNAGAPVLIESETHMPRGCQFVELQKMEDVLRFIERVRANRTSRGTLMNAAEGGHEGSSRSHAALILHLMQVDEAAGTCLRTSFSLLDLAGAERPAKAGGERTSGWDAMLEMIKGKELSIGAQGTMINYELMMIRSTIVAASDAYSKGMNYSGERTLTTAMVKFISGAFTGAAMPGMMVCLSPSGSNGWETWFSLEYGKDMASLRVPLKAERRENAAKKLEKLEKAADDALEALRKTPASGTPASKYYAARLGAALYLAQWHLDLAKLCEEAEPVQKAKDRMTELEVFDRSKFADAMKPGQLGLPSESGGPSKRTDAAARAPERRPSRT